MIIVAGSILDGSYNVVDQTLRGQLNVAGSILDDSYNKPKPFFASRADMVFMIESRDIQLRHLGQDSSF